MRKSQPPVRPALFVATAVLSGLLASLLGSPAVSAQAPADDRPFRGEERVTAVDLNLELRNELGTVSRVVADRIQVREGGQPLTIVSVTSLADDSAEPWRLVVWVDRPLTPGRQMRASLAALARAAGALTSVGTVEIWLADPSPKLVLPATRDVDLVDRSLSRIAFEKEGGDELNVMRRTFLEPAEIDPDDPEPAPTASERARVLMAQERERVLASLDGLVTWIAEAQRTGPAALLWVHGGFEVDLERFYGAQAGGADSSLQDAEEVLGATLAAYGWVALPLRLRELLPPKKDRMSEFDRMRFETRDGIDGQSAAVIGFKVPLGGRKGRKAEDSGSSEPPLLQSPEAPLAAAAEATGGHLLERPDRVEDAISSLRRRVIATVQGRWGLDGRLRPIDVEVKSLRVRTAGWVRSGTPETVAEARARQMVRGELEPGPLFVSLGVDDPGDDAAQRRGEIEALVRVELTGDRSPGVEPERGPVRVTVAQGSPAGGIRFVHRVLEDRFEGDAWVQRVRVGREVDAEWLAVVVENLADGLWGASGIAMD